MSGQARLRSVVRAIDPERADRFIAAVFVAGNIATLTAVSFRAPFVLAAIAATACNAAVAVRRRAPLVAAMLVLIAVPAYQHLTHDPQGEFEAASVVLVFYLVGRREYAARQVVRTIAVFVAAFISCVAASGLGGALASWVPLMLAPAAVGAMVARRDSMTRDLTTALELLRAEQRRRAEDATAAERARVARDVHDVVAHGVSVMVIQAGAARLLGPNDPAACDAALQVVMGTGREALTDLRRVMGALRRDEADSGELGRIGRLDPLLARIRASGVTIELTVQGSLTRLPPALDLIGYRIVQEALTNVVKHAGPATVEVELRVEDQSFHLSVRDDGHPGPDLRGAPLGSGQGLAGMRERVTAFGGHLQAERQMGGGFVVAVELPLTVPTVETGELRSDGVPRTWPRRAWGRMKRYGDAAFAVAWLIALEIAVVATGEPTRSVVRDGLIVCVMCSALVVRRRWPLAFLVLIGVSSTLLTERFNPADKSTLIGAFTLAIPLFTLGAWSTWNRARVGLGPFAVTVAVIEPLRGSPAGGVIGPLVMGLLIWVVGRAVASQRAVATDLRQATERLEWERELRARMAVVRERTRIARDLNARVANDVVAMIVQAEAAHEVLGHDPRVALEAVEQIEQAGREALRQLRLLLGVLRAPQTPRPLEPAPLVRQPLHGALT